jgi:hypothetical protein
MSYRRQALLGLVLVFLYSFHVNAKQVSYEYDELGRISSVIYPNLTKVIYKYDELGNRIEVTAIAQDDDSDGDGIPDIKDAFPNNSSESFDTDGDGTSDNIDQFPTDSTESNDFDVDLIGNNADLDDDNDGVADSEDECPYNPEGTEDMDADGLCGSEDADTDGDGVPNIVDAFANDASERADADNDGIGDNADMDDDNDGVNDEIDQCPYDPTGYIDSDADGRCDNYVVASQGISFWNDVYTPENLTVSRAKGIEVGNKFISEYSGYVMGVRFYKHEQTQGVFVGNIWDYASKKNLGTVEFTNTTSQGWQEAIFDEPIFIEANKTYIVSYYAPAGLVATTEDYLETLDIVKGSLSMLDTIEAKGNGVFREYTRSIYPSKRTNGENYWVDIVFDVDGDGLNPLDDLDDDNDGVNDVVDACPFDKDAVNDLDNDGVCDIYDTDKDGDGIDDEFDHFPLDATETVDTDGDGVGDVLDVDDDNDTVEDTVDACPLDAKGYLDQNQNGRCDNANITEFGLSIWNNFVKPTNATFTDARGIEAGVYFTTNVDGYIQGIRFYKAELDTEQYRVNLWDIKTKKNLATQLVESIAVTGWQDVLFDQPVQVTANTLYIASYHSPKGRAIVQSYMFSAHGVNSGPLSAQSDIVNKGNGVYRINNKSVFPTDKGRGKQYWVDVIYEVDNDGIAPAIDNDDDDDGVPDFLDACPFDPAANQDMDGDNICDSQDTDIDGDGVANDSDQFPLDVTEYLDTDQDGLGNNIDQDDDNDSVLDAQDHCPLDVSGYFDQDQNGKCDNPVPTMHGFSLWSDLSFPIGNSLTPTKGIETGMQFISNQSGYVMGVRFYKTSENTGTHVGNLWDGKTRKNLASVVFVNETDSGWQTALFDTPILIESNKTYVVSYFSPEGNAAYQEGIFLDEGVVSGNLSLPSSAAIKGNGLYRYGTKTRFPTVKSKGNHYWVDVIYEVDGDGIAPHIDNDDDNDSVPDLLDACPLNPAGSVDSDNDGTCDSQDLDSDGDGVLNDDDLFPNDPLESVDTDLDGIGNTADVDDDNDTHLDNQDDCPLDENGYIDRDNDGYCDNANITEFGFSAWNDLSKPENFEVTPAKGIEVGMKFDALENGFVTGARYYKLPELEGEMAVNIWDAKTKRNLVTETFKAIEGEHGWQQIMFTTPVAIEAGMTYVVSYFSAEGQAVYQEGYFSERGLRSGVISVPSTIAAKGNGVYKYKSKSVFPNVNGKGKNYWVDIVFDIDLDGIAPADDLDNDNDTIPDTADACPFDPLGAIDTDNDTICDSEDTDIDGDSVLNEQDAFPYDSSEFADTDGDAVGNTADSDDDNDGVEDNADSCPLDPAGYLDFDGDGYCDNANSSKSGNTIWHILSTPKSHENTGATSIEVGMKFVSTLGGKALGVRFYKTRGNDGVHIGSLWDVKTKKKLAEALFKFETNLGWQEVLFDQSITLEPGKEYMVSYYAPAGNVVFDEDYFTTNSVISGSIMAIGGKNKNGFYRFSDYSRYPAVNGKGKNYWVDIVMEKQW